MFKKSKLYIGISLIVQAVSFLILFFSFRNKKKSLAATFFVTALTGGIIGGLCLYSHSRDEAKYRRMKIIDDAYQQDDDETDAFSEDNTAFEDGTDAAGDISITFDDIDLIPEEDDETEPEIEIEYTIELSDEKEKQDDLLGELENELRLIDSVDEDEGEKEEDN